jgi:hypothetical protein
MKIEQIRDRIVVRILDKKKIQKNCSLNLEKSVNSEIVKNQIRSQQDVAVTDEVRGGAKPKQSSYRNHTFLDSRMRRRNFRGHNLDNRRKLIINGVQIVMNIMHDNIVQSMPEMWTL